MESRWVMVACEIIFLLGVGVLIREVGRYVYTQAY